MQYEEELVPSLAEASERCEVEDLVADERHQSQQDKSSCEEEQQAPASRAKDSVPDHKHAGSMQKCQQTKYLSKTSVEDIQRFIRVPSQKLQRLVLGGKEVEKWQICDEEIACPVREDEDGVKRHRTAIKGVEGIDSPDDQDEE